MARTAVRLQRPEVSWSTIRRQGSTGLVFAHQDMKMHVTHRRAMHAGPPHQVPAVIASQMSRRAAGAKGPPGSSGAGCRHCLASTAKSPDQPDDRRSPRSRSLGITARTKQRTATARRGAHAEGRNPCPARWNPDFHGPATHQRSCQLAQKLCLVADAQPDNNIVDPDNLAYRHQSGALRR
jgi:hypothetical protein